MTRRFSDRIKGAFGFAILTVAFIGACGGGTGPQVAYGLLCGGVMFVTWEMIG